MQATTLARWTTITLLWLLAIWNAWECRGLFSDGAQFLVEAVHQGWFWRPDDKTREYAIDATQIPLVLGVKLGITDLHWLARLSSFGLFAVPTVLYQMALMRAKDDAVLLAAVIAAVALVFMTTSFFIIGEYNTGYALTIAAAVWIVTSDRPSLLDGVMLSAFAVLALRTYESFLLFGPMLAAMIVLIAPRARVYWLTDNRSAGILLLLGGPVVLAALAMLGLRTAPLFVSAVLVAACVIAWCAPRARPMVVDALQFLAVALFLAGAVVAAKSCGEIGPAYARHVAHSTSTSWRHIPLDLAIGASLVVIVWAWARPRALSGNLPYLCAGLLLVLLALSPLLIFADVGYAPLTGEHYLARMIAGLIVMTIVGIAAVRKICIGRNLPVLAALDTRAAAPRCVLFFLAMLLAMLPSAISSTMTWISFLDATRATVWANRGPVPFEHAPAIISRINWFDEDMDFISLLSLALRSRPGDGVILLPESAPSRRLPDLDDRFFWRN